MIKISKRLTTIAELVEDNLNIVDIGCDHGLLDIYLTKKYKNVKIIANDINESALKNAKDNISKYKAKNIETRLGNGLDVVNKNEIDTIIISGLGAHTIVGVLSNNLEKLENVNNMIIQSNNNLDFLREKVIKLGFCIENEKLVEEKGIIYTIIKFKKGKIKYNKKQLLLGPILLEEKNKLFIKKCRLDKEKLELILKNVPKNNRIYRYKLKRKIKIYNSI